ncbi:MAG: sodium-dependent transporter [Caldimicrobium sp.]|nr:sodium-dependent transporter [Caldimicrobium sp.]MCX7613535.1 sodium-dependent transporter [Caldimicrobium sp.]MDW8182541.1 sodium-dependent transporter [Caldimicrobium sp.]
MKPQRETWGTKIGLILAAAGNAVGLGNLLRFPSKAALYGGGAFMLPYFISLILLGLPVMLIEWVIGRYAGRYGHGSMTGIIGLFFKQASWARALGSLGVAIPILIVMYYIYIESWTLGFAFLSLFGMMPEPVSSPDPKVAMDPYLKFFKEYTSPSLLAGFFFWITLFINWIILQRGIARGIEITAKIGMPLLIIMGIFLGVISLSTNNWAGLEGLKFIYNLNFSGLKDPMIWIEASGQIFFTLSLGMGAIATYASYVKPREDVVKAGLWTAGVNEFVEVIIGASIAIPAAFAMFGALAVPELAKEGTFRIGFMTMPAILMNLPFGQILSFVWFMLLFIAALTSSLALIQPMVALFEDEMKWSHTKSVTVSMIIVIIGAHLCAFLPHFLDEFDFWAGAVFLLIYALLEIIIFLWVFGINNFYQELIRDSVIKIPKFFVYIMAIISPLFIVLIGYFWFSEKLLEVLAEEDPYKWLARAFIMAFIFFLGIIAIISRKRVLEGPVL